MNDPYGVSSSRPTRSEDGRDLSRMRIRTPARLHFGLLELCDGEPHRYGGVGVMVDAWHTQWEAVVYRSSSDRADSFPLPPSIREKLEAIEHATRSQLRIENELPTCRLLDSPPAHVGLGSGTQFAASIATLLAAAKQSSGEDLVPDHESAFAPKCSGPRTWSDRLQNRPASDVWSAVAPGHELSCLMRCSRRGKRSHIGLHGFLYGGLVVDRGIDSHIGMDADEGSNHFHQRTFSVSLCSDWKLVLICPTPSRSIFGEQENEWIRRCGAIPNRHRADMLALIEDEILPAVASRRFGSFADAIELYGRMAGLVFESVQCGPYRDESTARLVQEVKSLGGRGVGQTSWGPTIYAWFEDTAEAVDFVRRWKQSNVDGDFQLTIANPSPTGAILTRG